MQPLRLFLDTHDKTRETFPAKLTPAQFADFYDKYQRACREEGVVPLRTHLSYEAGRAFCLNLAPDAEAVRRAHARVGLPFDAITEVLTADPAGAFLAQPAPAA